MSVIGSMFGMSLGGLGSYCPYHGYSCNGQCAQALQNQNQMSYWEEIQRMSSYLVKPEDKNVSKKKVNKLLLLLR